MFERRPLGNLRIIFMILRHLIWPTLYVVSILSLSLTEVEFLSARFSPSKVDAVVVKIDGSNSLGPYSLYFFVL